eukprot:TRINITY_DN2282_c0_g3_i1.p1 TRINITY_DN2282_c0_g3~~TRINITY_DN2282_c0_g3_i1.p1  ORF type:complete len:591 (+),score=164.64 TRINITY_DN2282_c0_g3_i1:164-1774(+)
MAAAGGGAAGQPAAAGVAGREPLRVDTDLSRSAESAPTADSASAEAGGGEKQQVKAKARARTFTTLRAPPPTAERSPRNARRSSSGSGTMESPTAAAAAASAAARPPGVGQSPKHTDSTAGEAPTPAGGGEGDADSSALPQLGEAELKAAITPRASDDINFHTLFHACSVTGKRPADRLFLKNWRAFSEAEAEKFFAANPDHTIAFCYDLSDYDECAWNYRYGRFTTNEETEHFDDVLDALYSTKGSFMEQAVADKFCETVDGAGLRCCSCTMQGWRSSNEDAHCAITGLPQHPFCACFGVYDGHGGYRVAVYVAQHLHNIIDAKLPGADAEEEEIAESLRQAFFDMDAQVLKGVKIDHTGATGTTCNIVLVYGDRIVCANAGDSRAVLSSGGAATALSRDHKPDSPRETARIVASGSRVSGDARVEGLLAVSRALGDFDFKQAGGKGPGEQAVTALPDVTFRQRSPQDEFILQCCDGIWDCLTDDEACDFARDLLKRGDTPQQVCEALCDKCLAPSIDSEGVGTDNMSINLIVFS